MPRYCVDGESQPNGDHVVHNLESCSHLPDRASRLDLGEHESCIDAVAKALTAWSRLRGQGDDSAVVIVYTADPDASRGASSLQSFTHDAWPAIERALASAAEPR